MSGNQARKPSQSLSWQFLVIIGAFSVVVFFSFFAVAYVTPLHSVGGAAVLLQSTTENVQKTALNLLTGSKPQLRSEDHVVSETKSSEGATAQQAPINPALCKSVEILVNSTIGTGNVLLEVHHDWAPLGAARFCELVNAKYYDKVKFFRVLKNFMAQTGMHGDPATGKKWRKQSIADDKVAQSNKRGRVTFAMAGPNTRTTQIFFNTVDNEFLDGQGFAPFASVESGMEYIDGLYNKYGEGGRGDGKDKKGPNQGKINQEGNKYLDEVFPHLSYIVSAKIKV